MTIQVITAVIDVIVIALISCYFACKFVVMGRSAVGFLGTMAAVLLTFILIWLNLSVSSLLPDLDAPAIAFGISMVIFIIALCYYGYNLTKTTSTSST